MAQLIETRRGLNRNADIAADFFITEVLSWNGLFGVTLTVNRQLELLD